MKQKGRRKEIAAQLDFRSRIEKIELAILCRRKRYQKNFFKDRMAKFVMMAEMVLLLGFLIYRPLTQNSFIEAVKWIENLEESKDEYTLITSQYETRLSQAVSKPRIIDEEMLKREKKYYLAEDDYNTLLRIVEAEASGEGENGKLLVANVILNRVNSKKFPNNVTEVVFQRSGGKTQFAPTRDGRFYSVRISQETINAVERAIYGEDISGGALYFVAAHKAASDKVSWFRNKLTYVCTYGGHEFYR